MRITCNKPLKSGKCFINACPRYVPVQPYLRLSNMYKKAVEGGEPSMVQPVVRRTQCNHTYFFAYLELLQIGK